MTSGNTVRRARAQLLPKKSRSKAKSVRRGGCIPGDVSAKLPANKAARLPQSKASMPDIFISYARADRQLVEQLSHSLAADGWSLWWDQGLGGGTHFRNTVTRQLDAARLVVVVWTPNSLNSDWVRAEAEHAYAAGKLLIATAGAAGARSLPPPLRASATTPLDNAGALRNALIDRLGRPGVAAKLENDGPAESHSAAFGDIDVNKLNIGNLDGNFVIPIPVKDEMSIEDSSDSLKIISQAFAATITDPARRAELTKALLAELKKTNEALTSAGEGDEGPTVVAVAGRLRTKLRDQTNGFRARRDSYRKEYRRNDESNKRVKSRCAEDYTVIDFLNEEWADLIETRQMRSALLLSNDFPLYVAIRNYVRGLREGTFGRDAQPDATIEDVLKTPKTSVRVLRPWLKKAEPVGAERPGASGGRAPQMPGVALER